jgi:hypothetical protein
VPGWAELWSNDHTLLDGVLLEGPRISCAGDVCSGGPGLAAGSQQQGGAEERCDLLELMLQWQQQ